MTGQLAAAEVWTSVQTAHFCLIGDASEAELRQVGERLETFREVFHQLYPKLKLDGGSRPKIIVFKNDASYKPYKPKRADGTTDDAVIGFFQSGDDVNYIALSLGEKGDPFSTLFHEYVHLVNRSNFGGDALPLWLSEGIAEYFETLRVDANGNTVLGIPPNGHIRRLQKTMLPPAEFFSMDAKSLGAKTDEARAAFYAQSWAAVHFIFHSGKDMQVGPMDRLAEIASKGNIRGKDLLGLFPNGGSSLDSKLSPYIISPNVPTLTFALRSDSLKTTAPNVSLLTEGERLSYLGDLLSRTGRFAEAEPLLRRASAAEPKLDLPNVVLGLALIRQDRLTEARKYLERAITAGTANHLAYFYFAYALSREGMDEAGNIASYPDDRYAAMRNALTKAIELSPAFAKSYRLLAFIGLVSDRDLEASTAAIRKAIEVDPAINENKLLLAQLLLRQERYDEAGEIAEKLANEAKESRLWSDAREIIQVVNQYKFAKATGAVGMDGQLRIAVGGQPPIILKRSALTDADMARIDEERLINNLNILLGSQTAGEIRVTGLVEKIECGDKGIIYAVHFGGGKLFLSGIDFGSVKMSVLTEGERSFTLGCGTVFGRQLAVITYVPNRQRSNSLAGRLSAITFVPDFFRLKTAEELAAFRSVIVEDDRLFKARGSDLKERKPDKPNER